MPKIYDAPPGFEMNPIGTAKERDKLRDENARLEARLTKLEAKLAEAEKDAERLDLLDEWIANSKARGFRWNTFLFFVDKSARRQIDAELAKGGNNDW
jgi:multidrug resistance efflux pump